MALNAFSRTELLVGKPAMELLAQARVAVFGIGGVGGYTVEALARSGVGALDLIDDDRVCLTNINRQIYATRKTVGKYKVEVAKERILQINPWDAKMVKDISKAIQASDLGLTPSNDGKVIRLLLPELTEERRKELTKLVRKTSEESKVAIRSIRRDAVDQVKKLKKNSEITEDDQKKAEEDIQKLTDAAIKDIDKIDAEKEKEIMEVK